MAEDKKHLLVVDDDTRLRSLLQRYLREQGFLVSAAENAERAKDFLSLYTFDMLIVDIMMPKISGTEFLRGLRAEKNNIPVILLTAMGDVSDRVNGLEIGADDYVAKPFEPKELVLRINNILKRAFEVKEQANKLVFHDICYDLSRGELIDSKGNVIHITPVERVLLNLLGKNPGEVHSREELAEVLGSSESLRTVDVQITRLRKKIETDTKNPRYLQTIRGKGYMLISE